MLVREVMTRNPVTVRPEAHVAEALRLLDLHEITALPVVAADGVVVGVLSEADLIRSRVLPDARGSMLPPDTSHTDPARDTVGALMTSRAITVSQSADVAGAADLMTRTGVKSLPVVDGGRRLVGVLSRRDIVHALARGDADIERELDELLTGLGTGWTATCHDGTVTVTGPFGPQERAAAVAAASTVAGVVHVRTVEAGAGASGTGRDSG